MTKCHNRLSYNYSCKDAIEDLNMAIQKSEAQRNKEEPRRSRGSWFIQRKW